MKMKSTRWAAALVGLYLNAAAGAERAYWVVFDQTRIEPNARLDGRVETPGGELAALRPVLFEAREYVQGAQWRAFMEGSKQRPGRRRITNRMRRNKGLVLSIAGAPARVRLKTALGDAEFDPRRVSPAEATLLLGGKLAVMEAPAPARLSSTDSEDEFPGAACDRRGRVWVAWQSWNGRADSLFYAVRSDGSWSKPAKAADYEGDFYRIQLCADARGVWAVWSEQREGNWDLFARRLSPEPAAAPIRLTREPGSDFNQALAAGPDGTAWLTWQAERGGQYDVFLARLTDAGLKDVKRVSESPANDWEPAAAVAGDGSVVVVWDTYRHGSYDIYMRRLVKNELTPARPVACTGDAEMRAAVVCDRRGRVWAAWENAGPFWGKHRPGGKRGTPLHRFRRVELCCFENGKRLAPATPVARCRNPEIRGVWELPRLAVDARDRLVLLFRHMAPIQRWNVRRKRKERQSRCIWAYFATRYDGRRWTRPVLLAGSEGRQVQRAAPAQGPKGEVWAAYAGDGRCRTRAEIPINNNVFAARLPEWTAAPRPPELTPAPIAEPLDLNEPARPRRTVTLAGQTYRLLYGDTHRHTDISRCGMGHDGSLLDAYRYAIDAVRLDFLAISDHDQDILKHRYDRKTRPLQNYMWRRSEKMCDLFQMTAGFLTLYGYEHGGSWKRRGGHKNVVYATRGNPCFEQDAPADLFRMLKGRDAIAIPHQLADGPSATDWTKWNREFEPVAEIFQARGSYEFNGCPRLARVRREGFFWWDALAKGCKVGAIASSDHGLVHNAYAAVWVKRRSRRDVLEAMRARRTFGSTEVIALDFRIGDRFMGEEISVDGPPRMRAKVLAVDELARVDVTRNGRFIYTYDPPGAQHEFEFTDDALAPGESAYYILRCVQADGELAWSSPIWVTRR